MDDRVAPSPEPLIRRRSLLAGTAAAAAGVAFLREAVGAEANPAANVGDRVTALKISALRAFPAGFKAYLRIDTNLGISGWGEITGLEPKVACLLAESLFELLDGENPTRIEHLWQKVYRSHRDMRGGGFMTDVLSAIDMALWDIAGRAWGVPVYRLLGGPTRDVVRMYPTPKAHKAGTGGPHPWSADPPRIEGLVRNIRESRERVGPDGAVMFDAHSAVPPPMLIQLAAAVEPYNLLWIEEPAVPGNIEVFKRLKQQIRIPLATGERDRTIWGIIPYLQERCVDILQPDVGMTGGITQMRKIAVLAEAYNVPLAPHCTCSELGLSAGIHAMFATPNFLIQEGYLDNHQMPKGVATRSFAVNKDGDALPPQGPGLGVEMNEALIAEANADPKRQFKWPSPKAADGGVTDY